MENESLEKLYKAGQRIGIDSSGEGEKTLKFVLKVMEGLPKPEEFRAGKLEDIASTLEVPTVQVNLVFNLLRSARMITWGATLSRPWINNIGMEYMKELKEVLKGQLPQPEELGLVKE